MEFYEIDKNKYTYVDILDQVALLGKWVNDHIYIGSFSGDLLELSSQNDQFYKSRTLPAHCLAITDIGVSNDGQKIVSSSLDGTCVLTDAKDFKRIREINCPDAFSPHCAIKGDGSIVAVIGDHGSLYIDNGSETFSGRVSDAFFRSVKFFGEDESKIICLARHTLAQIDVETRQEEYHLYGSTPQNPGKLKLSINCFATHHSHKQIPVGTVGGYVQFFDFKEPKELVSQSKIGGKLIESMEFTQDGYTLAIASSDRTIRLMDMRTKTISDELKPQRSRILSVSFNNASTKLVSISEDQTAIIANVRPKDI
ncbi:WD-40 repeat-containing protein [Histomonas meleagridis]|uniref:WD-40 repeat-containing protein n=1 Tax=Histomonas meleagridis TaxID=135588 RepID=UPI00355A85EC|nr:WD-40 repeat-containing protein [Histomonas meleagridis]KAH0803886.1 WD-40 repeat-containing protein [Histomonas meleagridis]